MVAIDIGGIGDMGRGWWGGVDGADEAVLNGDCVWRIEIVQEKVDVVDHERGEINFHCECWFEFFLID